ncbi:MAG: hypothetical protein V4735_05950 [Pseudomonadota bacterium]
MEQHIKRATSKRLQPLKAKRRPLPRATSPDDAIAPLIRGLGLLMAHAQTSGLGTAARILSTAREDMVHWAVDMNFHESAKDQFINHHLFGPADDAAELLRALIRPPATSRATKNR